ncbi:MFS transporter [Sphaerisporangium rufum]|uniref:MFS transporter n=1 Tax=Sphaerisporangium rufum TaxID=1381558 RepID=A0A919QVU5_9ACTN|nr:DHA2 family efflux MFS transporter permease subunit [Sphaerisporangium rufum]GII75084.1 MFS transporter [Sphaerisporangium rufum]
MAQALARPSGAPARPGHGHPWFTLLTVALGVIMVMLDGTVVAVANPVIGRDLNASLADLQWVTSGYLLALAVFLITAGKLGDLFGHKRVFLVGVVGFAATSLAIGLSSSIGPLIALRVLQGLFGALLQPAALALLRAAFPAGRLSMAIGIWGAAVGVSSAAGPIVGGLLVENVGWQSVFFINVPVGAVALAAGLWVLRESRARPLSRIDVPGVALLSGAMFCLLWAIIKAPSRGWGDPWTIAFLAGAVVLGAGFAHWQRRSAQPLLPLGLFRNVSVSAGTALMVLMTFSMFGAMFFLTFFLQGVHGLSPLDAGLRMLPLTAGMAVTSPLAGALLTRFGPKAPIAGGMLVTAAAMFLLSRIGIDAGYADTAVPFALLAAGLSPVMVGATEVIVGNAPEELSGVAGGMQQSAMQVGGALGTAVLGALITAEVAGVLPGRLAEARIPVTPAQVEAMKDAVALGAAPVPPGAAAPVAEAFTRAAHLSFLDGMHFAFAVAAAVAVLAVLPALLVRPGRPAGAAPVHAG